MKAPSLALIQSDPCSRSAMASHLAGGIPSTRKSSSCERARGLERAGEKGLREIHLPAKSITRPFHTSLRHALCATSGQFLPPICWYFCWHLTDQHRTNVLKYVKKIY